MIWVLLLASCLVVSAFPVEEQIPIVSQENDSSPDGSFHYSFESGNGIKTEQKGVLKTVGKESGESVEGSYAYPGEDGKMIVVKYVADERGYRAEGEHLPVAPPVPLAIARAVEYLKSLPPPKE